MNMSLTPEQIINQSKSAMRQWESQWRKHAEYISKYEMKNMKDFEGSGAGRACLLAANGWSLEKNIEVIKAYQKNIDIMCCDKSLGHLLENGIVPTFCLVADANVKFEKYMEKWKDKLQDTILIANVCANPEWADKGNWKDRYFFCVKDAINSQEIFQPLSKCPNIIAAGTNVSNSMLIALTQCDNERRVNFFGYDKYLLIGFDYCWLPHGNYYAFDYEGGGKRYYMRHIYGRTIVGDLCYSSNNLVFSMQWLQKYITAFNLPVIQCSGDAVLNLQGQNTRPERELERHLQYSGSVSQTEMVYLLKKYGELMAEKVKIEALVKGMRRKQYYDFAATA